MGASAILGIPDQDTFIEDLGSDSFLSAALQRVMCDLYHHFGSALVPLSMQGDHHE